MENLLNKLLQKKKKTTIKFCQNNLDQFLEKEVIPQYNAFFNDKHVSMKEYTCLSECDLCKNKPYAKVNGEIIKAKNSIELLNGLKQLAKK